MARQQDDSALRDYLQQSIRFAPDQLAWLSSESKRTAQSVNAIVRQLVEDAQTFYELAPTMAETLEKDRLAMGLDVRRYMQELLTQRYRDLLRAEFEAQSGSKSRK